MSERYSSHRKTSSRNSRVESPRTKRRKNSYSDYKKRKESEAKTPPLPRKRRTIEDLLIQRESLKDQLQKLDKTKSQYSERKKRKISDATSPKKHPDRSKPKSSPDIITLEHIDSEDEENIIEQRRLQRKKLLEKFNEPKKVNNIQSNDTKQPSPPTFKKEITHINNTKESTIKNEIANVNSISKKEANKDGNTNATTDMFSEKDDFVHKNISISAEKKIDENNAQLFDNWDDPDGYYKILTGDTLKKRYVIKDILGKGVFANVVSANDITQNNMNVAIKIVRNNDLMYNTSLKEIAFLKEIREADPENKSHCVQLLGNFIHKGHLCIVLEPLHMDLRNVLKKYGKNQGISVRALASYTRQLLMALRLLKKIGIIHADIKPDNILVNEKKNTLKLCDFGSATNLSDNEPTPYLVSRFYRAPEVILGIAYNHAIDIWSTACTIYEMSTGKILFTGSTNNKMLKCFMELKGRIPVKLIKKGKFKDQHFNYNNNFLMHKKDEFTGRDKVSEVSSYNITRDLYKELQKANFYWTSAEEKKIVLLKDLLDKMLALDYNQRISVADCFKHPFIQNSSE